MLNEEQITKDILQILDSLLATYDNGMLDNFEEFKNNIKDLARATIKIYCANKLMKEQFSSYTNMLDEYKEQLEKATQEQVDIMREYKKQIDECMKGINTDE